MAEIKDVLGTKYLPWEKINERWEVKREGRELKPGGSYKKKCSILYIPATHDKESIPINYETLLEKFMLSRKLEDINRELEKAIWNEERYLELYNKRDEIIKKLTEDLLLMSYSFVRAGWEILSDFIRSKGVYYTSLGSHMKFYLKSDEEGRVMVLIPGQEEKDTGIDKEELYLDVVVKEREEDETLDVSIENRGNCSVPVISEEYIQLNK